jgi:hypothetical protein
VPVVHLSYAGRERGQDIVSFRETVVKQLHPGVVGSLHIALLTAPQASGNGISPAGNS